nr:MAG TPA: hypothetical protein [Bacteriophage sp.]
MLKAYALMSLWSTCHYAALCNLNNKAINQE